MKKLATILFCICQLGHFTAIAQTSEPPSSTESSVDIVVRAKGGGKIVKRAEVRLGTDNFYTDPQGKVTLKIPGGEGKVMISRFGFDKLFVDYATLRKSPVYEVYLYPAAPSDNEVYVRGEKRPETSKKTISIEESKRIAPNDDPAQVVQLMPGVQTSTFGTDIAVRGSAPSDSKYFVDNMAIQTIFHAVDDLSVMPDQLISDVEFYAGGFGSQYGDATGGIIVLRTTSEIPEDAKTEFKVNLPFYSAIFHEKPLSDHSMIATSLRYSYLQYLLPYILKYAVPDGGFSVTPYFGDTHVFYLNKNPTGGHTKVIALGSQDGVRAVFPYAESTQDDGSADINFYHGFATIGVEQLSQWQDGWSTTTTPQFTYDKTNFDFASTDTLNWDGYFFGLRTETIKRISKTENFYLGLEPNYGIFYSDITAPSPNSDPLYDYEDAERRTLKQRMVGGSVAGWTGVDFTLGGLTISPGARVYYDQQIKGTGVDPRLALRLPVSEKQTLKSAVGLYSRSPEPWESDEVFGNPDLEFERSIHYVLGWEAKWADRWETDLQLYAKTLYDGIVNDPNTNYSNAGRGRSKGVEVFVRRNLTDRMFGWLSYTYSKTEERDEENQPWRPSAYDQTHIGQLVGSYRLSTHWELGGRFKYHTGDTYTGVSDAVYNSSLDKYQPRSNENERNNKRLPDYHQIDLFATEHFMYNHWKLALRYGYKYLAVTKQVYGRSNNYDYSKEQDSSALPPIGFIELKGEI